MLCEKVELDEVWEEWHQPADLLSDPKLSVSVVSLKQDFVLVRDQGRVEVACYNLFEFVKN